MGVFPLCSGNCLSVNESEPADAPLRQVRRLQLSVFANQLLPVSPLFKASKRRGTLSRVSGCFGNYLRAELWNVCATVLKSHLLCLLAAPQRTALPPLCWTIQLHGVPPPPNIPLGALGTGETDREEGKYRYLIRGQRVLLLFLMQHSG